MVPNLFGTRDGFHRRQFFHRLGWGCCLGMIQLHYLYCALWKWKSESIRKSVLSDSCDPMDCSLPESSVLEILQARILEWVAIPFSKGSSWPKVSCIAGRFFTTWATREAQVLCWWGVWIITFLGTVGGMHLSHLEYSLWLIAILPYSSTKEKIRNIEKYLIGQKVPSGFSIHCYRKPWMNFLANR